MGLLNRLRRMVRSAPAQPHERYASQIANLQFIHINKCGGTSVEAVLGMKKVHETALQRIDKIGRASWDRSYTFAIVRHPYAKVASHFRYRIKTNQTRMGEAPPDIDTWIAQSYGAKDPTYYDIPLMFAPCLEWITDTDGKVIVDQILKLETIDEDWQTFKAATGIDLDLPHKNQTDGREATPGQGLSPESRAIIDAHFAEDFAQFGYAKA